MKLTSFRIPAYLHKQVMAFAESRAMGMSEALRFIIEDYLKEVRESNNLLKHIRQLDRKIDTLADSPTGQDANRELIEDLHQLKLDNEKMKKALMVLGSASPRTKGPLTDLFPEYSRE